MNRQLILDKLIKNELSRYKALFEKMEADFKQLPKGSLIIKDNRIYRVVKYNNELRQIRLHSNTAEDCALIDELKYRRYIKEALPVLRKKINAIEVFQRNNMLYDPVQIQNELKTQYHGLANIPVFLNGDIDPANWNPGKSPQMYEDDLRHPSAGGLITRSKAEAMIATKLEESGLKFQYEPTVRLHHRTVRPDFKILHPHTRKFIYWEHLGKIDDPDYVMDNLGKLQEYSEAGIFLGIDLVITFETRNRPLTFSTIQQTINKIKGM